MRRSTPAERFVWIRTIRRVADQLLDVNLQRETRTSQHEREAEFADALGTSSTYSNPFSPYRFHTTIRPSSPQKSHQPRQALLVGPRLLLDLLSLLALALVRPIVHLLVDLYRQIRRTTTHHSLSNTPLDDTLLRLSNHDVLDDLDDSSALFRESKDLDETILFGGEALLCSEEVDGDRSGGFEERCLKGCVE